MSTRLPLKLNKFNNDVSDITMPDKFTFPFYYDPHPLAVVAAKELQDYIINQQDWAHNFGLPGDDHSLQDGVSIGKMFGVLVVKSIEGKIGYLCAFSGKLAESNHHDKFVPPVYDMLKEGDFFRVGGDEIIAINKKIERLEENENYSFTLKKHGDNLSKMSSELTAKKQDLKDKKKKRKTRREKGRQELNEVDFLALQEVLKNESLREQYFYKKDVSAWELMIKESNDELLVYTEVIEKLKRDRRQKSKALQNRLFSEYQFLNQNGNTKSLLDIFEHTVLKKPPAGAGECAAPKLLQYAFSNELEPIALAEFWWGVSPSADIKKHLNFYPACKGKCEPILNHMLSETTTEDNPLLINLGKGKEIEVLHEDKDLVIINKPADLLSVPGKNISDSVYSRMKAKFPKATGPLIVHRLDMSTSGIMLIPLNKESYRYIQKQFIKRIVKKRYVALLEGIVDTNSGVINLPLRLDIDDRPRQLVCNDHGKPSTTEYEVVERLNKRTKIIFHPLTGRTHQLRVHASHHKGLNTPIVGDDLYGKKSSRLHLHAETIEFEHPTTRERMKIQIKEEF